MIKRTTNLAIAAMLGTPLTSSLALADDGGGLSDAETSYSGAVMLQGDTDVFLDNVRSSDFASDDDDIETYAFWSGNTLYAGLFDSEDNSVDAIVEFFWFESSVDRGSDFYVAVIKARTSPGGDNALEVCGGWFTYCEGPVLALYTDTDLTSQQGAFRWDWSLPFDNYGIDAYGEVTFTNSYGLGASAEGAVMAHGEYDLDDSGAVKAAGDVQAKGFVSSDYRVTTQYQVTLWRWEMEVQGSAGHMDWALTLNSGDRDNENAYHEFFLAMQVEEGEPFTISNMDIVGTVEPGFWSGAKTFGLALEGITLYQPDYEAEEEEEDEWTDTGMDWEDTGGWWWSDDEDNNGSSSDDDLNPGAAEEAGQPVSGCSSTGNAPLTGTGFLALLGAAALRRRRRQA